MNFHDLERLLVLFQVFRGLNCTSESLRGNSGAVSDVTISRCLKEASLHDLLTVKVRKSNLKDGQSLGFVRFFVLSPLVTKPILMSN